MNTADSLTIGGLALALLVLFANARTWWNGGRNLKDIAPYALCFLFGAIATCCAGGLLGWLAGCSAGASNTVGAKAVPGATGTQSGSALAHGDLGSLTPEGGIIVFVATGALIFAWKSADKTVTKRMAGGLFCGSTLCLTAGIAGLMNWLPPVVNQAGAGVRALVESGI